MVQLRRANADELCSSASVPHAVSCKQRFGGVPRKVLTMFPDVLLPMFLLLIGLLHATI